ncbi:translocation/assembly module TamB domain-containing protein [Pseudomaricurvus sp. HS19]|uniref:translocation/assembly module TamB domain-containing protein n=1 Tax=Pseudomaricurvus sp. HS19 TaxID=2692626 RepID=UPI00136AD1D4|nr:translocation/assembly module TamB [Pseudomaricurvus sp. HS19]MYM64161.1 hypothetical protein [Pseudomaricurvus sp. HS19]
MNSTQPPTRSNRWRPASRLAAIVAAMLLLCTVLLGITLAGLLNDPQGRVWLLQSSLPLLNRQLGDFHLQVEAPYSPAIDHWTFRRLTVYRQQQPLLQLENGEIAFNWRRLQQQQLQLQRLTAEVTRIYLPAATSDQPQSPPDLPALLQQLDIRPWQLQLQQLHSDRLEVMDADGQALMPALQLQAELDLWTQQIPLRGNVSAQSLPQHDEPVTRIRLSSHSDAPDSLLLQAQIEEPAGGWLGQQLHNPPQLPLQLQAQVELHQRDDVLDLQLRQVEAPWQQHLVRVQGKMSLSRDLLQLHGIELGVTVDEQSQLITGSASADRLDLQLQLQQLPLTLLTPWIPQLQAGNASGTLQLRGTPQQPLAEGDLQLALTWVEQQPRPQQWQANGSLSGLLGLERIALKCSDVTLQWQSGEQQASGRAQVAGDLNLASQQIDIRGAGQRIDSDLVMAILQRLEVQVPEQLQPLQLRADVGNFQLRGPIDRQWRHTNMQWQATAEGAYHTHPLQLQLLAEGRWPDFQVSQARLHNGDLQVQLQGRADFATGQSALQWQVDNFDPLLLNEFMPQLWPQELLTLVSGRGTLRGNLLQPDTDFDLHGPIHHRAQPHRGQLQLRGRLQPAALTIDEAQLSLQQDGSEGHLTLTGQLGFGQAAPPMHWQLHAEQLPMALASSFNWPDTGGTLSANLQLQLPAAPERNPQWLQQAQLSGSFYYRSGEFSLPDEQLTYLQWRGELGEGDSTAQLLLDSQLQLANNPQQPGEVQLSASKKALAQWLWGNSTMPGFGLRANADLQALGFLMPADTSLGGRLDANLTVNGQAAVQGYLQLQEGYFSSTLLGLRLQPFELQAEADGKQLRLTRLHADDGLGGILTGTGALQWQRPDADNFLDIDLQANALNLVQRHDVQGTVSGNLHLSGSLRHWLMQGTLLLDPITLSLDSQLPGDAIPAIDVSYSDQGAQEESGSGLLVDLDLTLKTDRRAYLRGRGLDAELSGQLHLGGTAHKPEISGSFELVRGHFDLLGQRFTLTQGDVSINDSDLTLLASGTLTKAGVDIRADLSGTSEVLRFTLTSDPPMPEDEILSWMLFGKSLQAITPMQALQLANGISTLQGGGFDPIGSTRDFLQLDSLTVGTQETDDGSGVNVGAGKYLGERVYMELEHTGEAAEPWRTGITIELTPKLNLRSTLSTGTSKQGVELEWHNDY